MFANLTRLVAEKEALGAVLRVIEAKPDLLSGKTLEQSVQEITKAVDILCTNENQTENK